MILFRILDQFINISIKNFIALNKNQNSYYQQYYSLLNRSSDQDLPTIVHKIKIIFRILILLMAHRWPTKIIGLLLRKRRNVQTLNLERGNSDFSQSLRGYRFSDTKAIMDFFNKRPRLNSFDQFTRANSHPQRPPRRPSTPSLLRPTLSLSLSPTPVGYLTLCDVSRYVI